MFVRVVRFTDVSAEHMSDAASVLDSMDASDAPGRRVSVDRCESQLDLQVAG